MAEHELGGAQWRGYREEDFPQRAWSVDGDVLRAMAQGVRVDLVTREAFGDFTLHFDWRLPRGGSTAVLCRVDEEAGAAGGGGAGGRGRRSGHNTGGGGGARPP